MALLIDIVSWVLLSLGGAFVFIGGLGALRMPNLYTRIHAGSLTDTMGAMLVIAGIMLQAGASLATIKLAAILLFLLLTSPTASNTLASAALLAGVRPEEHPKKSTSEQGK
ncbi:MAG: monovalent cation/H(+) antiporter subunit G [Candidatus Thiodiazotropha sp. (ex. Lucinoma kazani)]|nr:monovalent cation/H(+) antiporter subunit G [Candidatus Thiodiazotropha sp. (ex Lucinoma borealis)]